MIKSSGCPASRPVDKEAVGHPAAISEMPHSWLSPDQHEHLQRSSWMMPQSCGTSSFKWPSSFQQIQPVFLSLFCQVTGQLMAEKLRYLSSFNQAPSHATAQPRREKKSLSALMSKASIFTEQLGASSQRSDVRIHYGSATANCFKVKVTDLTALYFKWQTQILVVFHRTQRWH